LKCASLNSALLKYALSLNVTLEKSTMSVNLASEKSVFPRKLEPVKNMGWVIGFLISFTISLKSMPGR